MNKKLNKKFIITGLTCIFILFSGICYSCAYQNKSALLISSDSNGTVLQEESSKTKDRTSTADTESFVSSESETLTNSLQQQSQKNDCIYVHICGAVVHAGVYPVAAGARLVDLIALSGGLSKEADGDYINQAQQVFDGQRIYIPTKEELKNISAEEYQLGDQSSATVAEKKTDLVNINTADAVELMKLPGIGQAKANSIIAYRTSNGKFKTIEDLMKITGIKQGLFNQISTKITVN